MIREQMREEFESNVILNRFKTPKTGWGKPHLFESNVILNRFKTEINVYIRPPSFESNVILNRFKTLTL